MSPPRPVMHALWALHKLVRRISGGRLGTSTAQGDGMGTLFLHTIGRRTGQPRVNGLFYVTDGPNVAVAASNAGASVDPAWLKNLRQRPDAEIEIGGKARPVHARPATEGEAARAGAKLDQANPEYVHYRAEAHRPIPLLILEPR